MPAMTPHDRLSSKYEALLGVTKAISSHREIAPLLDSLNVLLHSVVEYDHLLLILFDAETGIGRVFSPGIPPRVMMKGGHPPAFEEGPAGEVWRTHKPILSDINRMYEKFPNLAPIWAEENLLSTCAVPLSTARRRLGALEFCSTSPDAYLAENLPFIELVAAQVAIAIDSALNWEETKELGKKLRQERDRLHILHNINSAAVMSETLQDLAESVFSSISNVGVSCCNFIVHDPAADVLKWEAVYFPEGRNLIFPGLAGPVSNSPISATVRQGKAVLHDKHQLEQLAEAYPIAGLMFREGIQVSYAVPLRVSGTILAVLQVASVGKRAFSSQELGLFAEIGAQVTTAVDKILAYRCISVLRDKIAGEKVNFEGEFPCEFDFHEIVAQSTVIKEVLKQVQIVAPSDLSVLLLGETGTGKELIARAIHNLSPRSSHSLIKLNCAAIPVGLLESELFGHERGAFTGALTARVGRVELADKGSLFLDEVGDIPIELQPKLLRVLQEREFERVGSSKSVKTDFRLIAATNRDLHGLVRDRQFREDLYYRLNVFPIIIPPIRERREDIPPLVRYFTQKYATRMKKQIDTIPNETMQRLSELPWLGNVRELQNVVERAVLFTQGNRLNVQFGDLHPENRLYVTKRVPVRPHEDLRSNLEALQRESIVKTLREANGIIGGPRGAAQRLGMKRTTLLARMKKLGIAVSKSAAVQ